MLDRRFSDFWLDDQTKRKLDQEEELSPIELANSKSEIAQFVKIMAGEYIPVEYRTDDEGTSHTDGEKVTITAEVEPGSFDATVGVALHEASHVVKSDFDLLDDFEDKVPQDLVDKIEPLLKKSDKYKEIEEKMTGDSEIDPRQQASRCLHHIWNVVEDRWIDQWAYSKVPGYRGYYQKMYQKYWHSEDIGEELQSDEAREPNWSSYAFRVTNITNDKWDPDALPELRKIWDILDVNNIERHDSSWDTFETAQEILHVILDNIDEIYVHPSLGVSQGDGDDEDSLPFEDLPEDLQEKMKDQIDQMEGQAGEALDPEKAEEVDVLEDAGVDQKSVGEDIDSGGSDQTVDGADAVGVRCVVVDQISEALLEKGNIPILSSSGKNSRVVSDGIRIGHILASKLRIMDDRRELKYTRRRRGDIDNRMLAEIGFSDRLFSRTEIEEFRDGFLHISVDASGSMRGQKFENALKNCVALAKAADEIRNLRVQISFRSTITVSGNNRPLVVVAYDSKRSAISHVSRFFPHITATGRTPEGLSFEAIQNKVLPSDENRQSYFVNLSDGLPNFSGENTSYGGKEAEEHTAREVDKMRRRGVSILSYYVGGDRTDSSFRNMYGEDSRFIDVTDINDIKRTMNNKFLDKDDKKTRF